MIKKEIKDSKKEIWVFGDRRNQSLLEKSLDVLAGARALALLCPGKSCIPNPLLMGKQKQNVDTTDIESDFQSSETPETVFVIMGLENESEALQMNDVAVEAIAHGADRVMAVTLTTHRDKDGIKTTPCRGDAPISKIWSMPDMVAKVLADLVQDRKPTTFLFPLNRLMREIAARSAFLCHSGLIADCLQFKYESDEIIAVCPSHGGEILAELGFSDPSRTGFITVQSNAFKRERVDGAGEGSVSDVRTDGAGEGNLSDVRTDGAGDGSLSDVLNPQQQHPNITQYIETIEVSLADADRFSRSVKQISRKRKHQASQSLETAKKVVAGGAGLGNIEGFRHLRKLAAALGAQIGATRPPILWHWTDEDRLIGQTGKSIQPELLITIGTSGAVQYTAGITEAEMVVAVNRDPSAPIFQLADIGIVADANQFVPLLTEKIHHAVMRSLADSMDGQKKTEEGGQGSSDERGQGADFGSKLMEMRNAHGMDVDDLAKRTGRTPEFIEALENNTTTPSVGFMIQLAEVFGVDSGTFLNSDAQAELSENRAKEYTRRTANYHYQTLTPGAENEHLRVFMVTIESDKKHKPVAYRHEGEEFVYVMEGTLELTLDGRPHKLMAGESMKFNSQTPHQLKSVGSTDTKCLVTLYTP